MIQLIIAFLSIVILAALHEFGHFLIAKKCGVEVEEFGIGYPPRIFAKKIGGTVYSFNWLPLGAFVKMEGEETDIDSPTSFSNQSVRDRIWITLGGVISFWLIAIVIYSFLFLNGGRVVVQDSNLQNLKDFEVAIFNVADDSPAEKMGLWPGDTIQKISFQEKEVVPTTIEEVQNFVDSHLGNEINLVIERGEEKIEKSVLARDSFPDDEGPLGVTLVRTAFQKPVWYLAIWRGITITWNNTVMIVKSYGLMLSKLINGDFQSDSLVSSVGIFQMIAESQEFGLSYFLSFMAFLSINLAVFNSLPIPLVDGGRVLFLLIEVIRNEPISEKIQEKVNLVSFVFLGGLVIWVTIRDIINLF